MALSSCAAVAAPSGAGGFSVIGCETLCPSSAALQRQDTMYLRRTLTVLVSMVSYISAQMLKKVECFWLVKWLQSHLSQRKVTARQQKSRAAAQEIRAALMFSSPTAARMRFFESSGESTWPSGKFNAFSVRQTTVAICATVPNTADRPANEGIESF